MIIINSVGDDKFSINGVPFARIFQPLASGLAHVAIYNTYDTRLQILSPTHYSEISVNGTVYSSQITLMAGLLTVIYVISDTGGGGGSWGSITGTLSDQGDLQSALNGKLGTGAKAADSDKLDGIDSSQFLRSDAADSKTAGTLTFNTNIPIQLGTSNNSQILASGVNSYWILNDGNLYIRDGATIRWTFERSSGSFTATGAITASTNLNAGISGTTDGTIGILKSDGGGVTVDWNSNYLRSRLGGSGTVSGWKWSYFDTERMSLTASGDLTISGTVTGGNLGIFGGSGNGSPLRLKGSGTGSSNTNFIQFYESNGSVRQGYFGFTSSSNSDMSLYNDVSGKLLQLKADGTFYYSSAGTFNGNLTATAFYESSLRELKENIQPFDKSGLEVIQNTEVVTFDRKDGTAKNKIGVIIDDSPKEIANDDQTAVDIYKAVFVAYKAIQEQQIQIDDLQAEIKELKARK